MAGRTYKATPTECPDMEEPAGIYARESPYLERFVQVGYAAGKLLRVTFPAEPDDDAETEHPLLDRIQAYLEGERTSFQDVDVALTIPTDQQAVLETLRTVPYGDDVSVHELARMTPGLDADADEADDVVRDALAANPVPLVVPDHRVRDGPSGASPDVEQKLRQVEGL